MACTAEGSHERHRTPSQVTILPALIEKVPTLRASAPRRYWIGLGIRLLTVGAVAAGCSSASSGASSSSVSPTGSGSTRPSSQASIPAGTYWMWSPGHLKKLITAGMSRAEADFFANSRTTIFNLTVGHQDAAHVAAVKSSYPNATIDVLFNSEAALATALATNSLPAGVTAVAYDPESIPETPAAEQSALGSGDTHFVTDAIHLAHSHGYKLFFVPSTDVGMTGSQAGFPNKYTTWLSEDRGTWANLGEDLYSIQSQQAEGTSVFGSFVPAAVAQVRKSNGAIPVDVGIGINMHSPPTCITTQNLLDAYNVSIAAGATGFWNNVESGVNCNVPVSVYVQFFDDLYSGAK